MEIQGKIKVIGETQTLGSQGFTKRSIVITTIDKYPEHLLIEFIKQKCDLLDKYQVGQNVKINVELKGRKWISPQGETKYFNSIQGWQIENVSENDTPPEPIRTNEQASGSSNDDNDLPF